MAFYIIKLWLVILNCTHFSDSYFQIYTYLSLSMHDAFSAAMIDSNIGI